MAYEKRLCLLKQVKRGFSADGAPLTGAVYAERIGSELVITPKIAGLSPLKEGRYVLAVGIGTWKICLEMRGNEPLHVPEAPTLSDGFAVLLCCVNAEAEGIAFGRCGNAETDWRILLEVFGGFGGGVPQESAVAGEPPLRAPQERYDDETIASSDYYRSPPASDNSPPPPAEEEEPAVHPLRLSRRGTAYYNTIAEKIKAAFEKYPRDNRLSAAVPGSEWVKTEQALLGVVYAEGLPRFLCVALEKEPEGEAKEACIFVPFSPFSDEEGLYVVFQDADTGEYVSMGSD